MVYRGRYRKYIRFFSCLIILTVAGLISGCSSSQSKVNFSDDAEAINKASVSVVLLKCYDKEGNLYCTGSAFAAFEEGVYITNYHVLEQDVYSIVAQTEDQMMFEIKRVIASDAEKDIAIISTDAKTGIAPLGIGDSDSIVKGEKLVAIESSVGFANTVSTGIYNGKISSGETENLQYSEAISHGSSGGALFNDNGDVIGITCDIFEKEQNINIAIPINYAIELMEKAKNPLTVEEFYETFNHYTEYTVAEVLENKDTISDPQAKVYGYVADIYEGKLYLVNSETEIEECNMSGVEPKKIGGHISLALVGAMMNADQKAIALLPKTDDSFKNVKMGDYVCASMSLSPKSDKTWYTIRAEDINDITVIQ